MKAESQHDFIPWGFNMRKMIMMAVAGFLWKQIQKRFLKRTYTVRPPRRY